MQVASPASVPDTASAHPAPAPTVGQRVRHYDGWEGEITKISAAGKSAKEASAKTRNTAGCGFNMVWGWFRLKSWNSEWLLSAPGKACGATDGVWCVVESKSWMLRRQLLEKKRSGNLGDPEQGED